MAKHLLGVTLLVVFLSGCLVRTGPRHSHRRSSSTASCPPAYHWNGDRCVHNGKARGHSKHRKHRR